MSHSPSKETTGDGPEFQLWLVGLNHQTAPAAVREALAFGEPEATLWVRRAVAEGLADLPGRRVGEAVLLSTCNRTEAYLTVAREGGDSSSSRAGGERASSDSTGANLEHTSSQASAADHAGQPSATTETIEARLTHLVCSRRTDIARDHPEAFYLYQGQAAAHHLLRVAAGLDSMIQGEAQILGQVHRAHELAREAGGVGPVLDRLFSAAFRAGKRSRHETDIGRGAVSVASAAVELAVKVVGKLDRRIALVVGAGDTGRLVAQHFSSEQPHELWIANRTLEKAQSLAAEVGGRAFGLDDLPQILAQADVIAVATFAPTPVITRSLVQAALKNRRRSTVFIDISMPRNVEPSVHGLGEAFVYDLDALQRIVRENLSRREEEIPKVNSILEEEAAQFLRWTASVSAGPLISLLRDRFEQIRQEEIRRHARSLKPGELEAVDRVTRGLLNKFLHGPSAHLRNGANGDPAALELIRRMFSLDEGPSAEPARDDHRPAGSGPASTEVS